VLAALLTTATVVTLVLGWFGWRMLQQESAIQRERTRERLENGADAMAAKINGKLAESGERLSGWLAHPETPAPEVAGAVIFAHSQDHVQVAPKGALPYVPFLIPSRPAGDLFTEAEALEAGSQQGNAAGSYRKLSQRIDKRIRAGALLRLGRVLRKSKDLKGAMVAYQQLSELGDVLVEDYPAELAGLDGQRLTLLAAGDHDGAHRIAVQLAQHLDNGRWLLTRGMAGYFRDELTQSAKPESWLLAEVLCALWQEWQGRPPDGGLRAMESGNRRVVTLWRANAQGAAALAAFPENFVSGRVVRDFAYQLVDSNGKLVTGASSPPSQATARVIGDSWMLRVWSGGSREPKGGIFGPRAVLPMMAAVILFLWSSVYFVARAIRREAAVARLQSDFVATVSHEFRSPLTTVRQLAEMLEMGQVPSEARRQKYYQVLADEARRLQRLVETLLNFGKMEAGAQRYRMEELDIASLVRQVAGEVEAQTQESGRRIEIAGPPGECRVRADGEALALALRNLLDNAIKYSPAGTAVGIRWGEENGRVSVRVVDQGPGIDVAERDAVFRKFVRGRAAAEGNVKGTGVGLAMVRQILAAHGGEVQLESELGHGSTFTLLLPALN
jgi:signal transduction histidine kinase